MGLKFRNPFKKKKNRRPAAGPTAPAALDVGSNAAQQEAANGGPELGSGLGAMDLDALAAYYDGLAADGSESSEQDAWTEDPGQAPIELGMIGGVDLFVDPTHGVRSRSGGSKKKKGKDVLKDRHVRKKKALGGGSANDVTRVKYRREIGDSGSKSGFFKADASEAVLDFGHRHKVDFIEGGGSAIGMKRGDGRNSARAVTTGRLDAALGLDVVAHDAFAKHGGKVGTVSPQVQGESMRSTLYEQDRTQSYVDGCADWGEVLSTARCDSFAGGGILKIDEKNKRIMGATGFEYANADLSNPETQRGLADLQLLDALTGQVDRHLGNIFVDPETGSIKGIDNDLSFGSKSSMGVAQNKGLPNLVDERTAESVLAMTEAQFTALIMGKEDDLAHLNEAEIAQAVDNFHAVQEHVQGLKDDGRLIAEWNEETRQAALEDEDNNYMSVYDQAIGRMDDYDRMRT